MPLKAPKNSLSSREKQLILFLRKFERGEVRIRVENGQPVLIYEAIKTVKLEELSTSPSVNNESTVFPPKRETDEKI